MITDDGAGGDPATVVAGRYRMRELVGEGGMGSVWRATDTLLGREVAIKQVRLDLQPAGDAGLSRERTMREARIAAALHHPNVVTIFDVVTDGGAPWLVLEYLPSRSLGSILAEHRALHPTHVAQIGTQIASALAAAHAAGIVHRDVKPDNILIARAPATGEVHPGATAKLTDFGISHAATTPALTSTGVLTGTPAYFAPETARGEGTDARSDVYSLGATLYAAVEGHPPFGNGDDNVLALLTRIGQGGAPPPQRAGPPLADLLRRLTADDPAARPTAEQAQYALQALANWSPAPPPPYVPVHPDHVTIPVPRTGPPPKPSSRLGVVMAVLAVLLVGAVITTVTLVAVNQARPEQPPEAEPAVSATQAPTSTAAPAPAAITSIGDPRTADPCSLADAEALARFGEATVDRENTEFSACRVDITLPGGGGVTYTVDFLAPAEVSPAESTAGYTYEGELTVVHQPGEDDRCERRLLFPDGDIVGILAQLGDAPSADVCGIADLGTERALAIIAERGIGTRPPLDATSPLAGVQACSLLTPDELAIVPDGETAEPESEYGGWGCIWNPPTSEHLVRIDFYRRYPLEEGDGTRTEYAGRAGSYRYEAGRYCLAHIAQRDFTGVGGASRTDMVRVFVFGPGAEAEQCGYATALAGAIAAKLPRG